MTGIEKVEAEKYARMRRLAHKWMLSNAAELFMRTGGFSVDRALALTNPWNEEATALLAIFGLYLWEKLRDEEPKR